jgi:hypothetical protein
MWRNRGCFHDLSGIVLLILKELCGENLAKSARFFLFAFSLICREGEEQGNKGTREQENRGTGEQGNKGTREQGNKGAAERW